MRIRWNKSGLLAASLCGAFSLPFVQACTAHLGSEDSHGAAPGGELGAVDLQNLPDAETCGETEQPGRQRLWLLSPPQLARTLYAALHGRPESGQSPPAEGVILPSAPEKGEQKFSNRYGQLRIGSSEVKGYFSLSETASPQLEGAGALGDCGAAAADQFGACVRKGLEELIPRLFRRPALDGEVERLAQHAISLEKERDAPTAISTVVQAMLLMPSFLYRTEVGDPSGALSDHEVASALSYTLLDSPPDQRLNERAKAGDLHTTSAIDEEVERLLQDPAAASAVRRALFELFDFGKAASVEKEEKFHRGGELVQQAESFVEMLLAKHGRANFQQALFTFDRGVASKSTYQNYDVPEVTDKGAVPVQFTGSRAGVLGHPAWLSGHSFPERNDPVHRGVFVYERLLCGTVPNVPIEGVEPLSEDPKLTLREKLVQHRTDPSCSSCHALMDGIGLGLEAFDEYGRERDMELDQPVDTSAELTGAGSQDGPFDGLEELNEKLAASEVVTTCLASNTVEFFAGDELQQGDACTISRARSAFVEADGDYVELIKQIFSSPRFLVRTPKETAE